MLGWVTFPIQIDREKWQAFKDAVYANGGTLRAVLESLIDTYIAEHRPTRKDKKS